MEFKRLKNESNAVQWIMVQGKRVALDPGEERDIEGSIAQRFIDQCFGSVREVSDGFGAEFDTRDGTKEVWLANVTGDPTAPEHLEVKDKFINGQWVSSMVENPIKEARDLKEWAEGPMVEYTAKDGTPEAKNMPGQYITLPAFRRIRLPEEIADWFINRIHLAAHKDSKGNRYPAAIASRKPTNFEPDMTWDLDEIRAYLKLVDYDVDVGPEASAVADADEAKRILLKTLFFRIVRPDTRLPTRQELNEFMRSQDASGSVKKTDTSESTSATA